jgi:hypothetical protein
VQLAGYIARLAVASVTEEPRELAHGLASALIGDAVDDDDGDAVDRAHRRGGLRR